MERQRVLAGVLLRASLAEPSVADKVLEAVARGGLLDLRVRHVFHAVAESRRCLCSPLAYIHGDDMREWFEAEANCYEMRPGDGEPVEAAVATMAELRRMRDERLLDVLHVKAREALRGRNDDAYKQILSEQQELRRRLRTIVY
jgi:hypothetical protein